MEQKSVSQLTIKDILEKDFKTSFRGYDQDEVDEFLDQVIKDYEAFEKRIESLETEVERFKKESNNNPPLEQKKAQQTTATTPTGNTNYDILKRLSNLEKHVFGGNNR
ncbi:cell division regulator GpsB [Texcoconibacillus texcoconensis]|uniref:DivIVA domain-containing protein n=1 Tax=Texcoconibacillus texcoconensis TaxID=1095777 RepID=A0A840QT24_9BACI|nr:cell division regulator GpsB [Texcoconibacillus texcoconensis]MBB5174515.1 DivIVA domain-containing protein [Texcoconibacillus texcoconensis]